jgi:hypothetical protein
MFQKDDVQENLLKEEEVDLPKISTLSYHKYEA